eukprot:COSAG01_NODE_24744_length_768_cov_0.982063_1_plen_255_part_11
MQQRLAQTQADAAAAVVAAQVAQEEITAAAKHAKAAAVREEQYRLQAAAQHNLTWERRDLQGEWTALPVADSRNLSARYQELHYGLGANEPEPEVELEAATEFVRTKLSLSCGLVDLTTFTLTPHEGPHRVVEVRGFRDMDVGKVLVQPVQMAEHQLNGTWECELPQGWTEYPPDVNEKLEHGFAQKSLTTFQLGTHSYEVDFSCFDSGLSCQRNIATRVERQMRRVFSAQTRDDAQTVMPSSWTPQPQGQHCTL